jgi:hypothetical protein
MNLKTRKAIADLLKAQTVSKEKFARDVWRKVSYDELKRLLKTGEVEAFRAGEGGVRVRLKSDKKGTDRE